MTVKELREKLESVPDDALVCVEARDHKYREVEATPTKAWVQQNGRGSIDEADLTLGPPPLGHDEIDVLVFA